MRSLFAEPKPLSAAQVPRGFRFASSACGLKENQQPDLALIASDTTAMAAAVFTTNRVKAAPVIVSQQHLARSRNKVRAIISNSGNANCATGAAGVSAARATAAAVGRQVGCAPEQVLVCSTGIIGVALEVDKILGSVPKLVRNQAGSPEAFQALARAIMTTDTRPKWAAGACKIGGQEVRLLGCAKGAGMIHPKLATMLAFVVSDVALSVPLAQRALADVATRTFNAISVDGDTSTNDTLILLANGASGSRPIRSAAAADGVFVRALESVCKTLGLAIVADGEGATRVAEIEVRGAASDALAAQVARTIATSPLVKTALAGADPNWGRILAAAGRTPLPQRVSLEFSKSEIRLSGIVVCRRGSAHPFDENAVHHAMLEQHVPIVLDLKSGSGRATVWTCDFTDGYIRTNTEYRS
jgi:glutamate N-acetyltransferase / amino-acid N-acetyltransferase